MDLAKGCITAAVTGGAAVAGQIAEAWLTSPTFSIDKVSIALTIKAAAAGLVGYLFRKFFTPAQVIVPVVDPKSPPQDNQAL